MVSGTLSVIAARCQLPQKGELFRIYRATVIKLPLRGKTSPALGEDVTAGDKRGNLAATNGSRLRGFESQIAALFFIKAICNFAHGFIF